MGARLLYDQSFEDQSDSSLVTTGHQKTGHQIKNTGHQIPSSKNLRDEALEIGVFKWGKN